MKKIKLLMLSLILCISFGIQEKTYVYAVDDSQTENAEDNDVVTTLSLDNFSVYVMDDNGNKYNQYITDDNTYYLFIPTDLDMENLEIYYTGNILSVSEGTIDNENKKVSVSLDNQEGFNITVSNDEPEVQVVVMQSNLPSISVWLNDTTLDEIHADKDVKHSGNQVVISDTENSNWNLTADKVEIKGRGNSSWVYYEKKGYQLKFSKKTSILGMQAEKKWVLLANACDGSLMRNKIIYDMAANMDMPFVSDCEYADLWIDGEYRGTYLVCEKVEISSKRLNLSDEDGILAEYDNAFYDSEDYWFQDNITGNHFTLKEAVNEELLQGFEKFEQAVYELDEKLLLYQDYSNWNEIEAMIDVDSFAKYYLINEYAANRESITTSFYWYKDGDNDTIHLGPIWDFDTCMGNEDFGPDKLYVYSNYTFSKLLKYDEFREYVNNLYNTYQSLFNGLSDTVMSNYSYIEESADMNYIRWDVLGTDNIKGLPYGDTYFDNVDTLHTWLVERSNQFALQNNDGPRIAACISEDSSFMKITIDKLEKDYTAIKFAVWSIENGQDDLVWYQAELNTNGSYSANASLANHKSTGEYMIHAYGITAGGGQELITYGTGLVLTLPTVSPMMNLSVSDDCHLMQINLNNLQETQNIEKVLFAVWSINDGQDDITWYTGVQGEDETWSYSADLQQHNSTGWYAVHAYAKLTDGTMSFIADGMIYVEKLYTEVAVTLDTEISSDNHYMDLSLLNYECEDPEEIVYFAVWSVDYGQDDIVWYNAESDTEGERNYTVDLQRHNSSGYYAIHVYAKMPDGTMRFITSGSTYVDQVYTVITNVVAVEVSSDYHYMNISLTNYSCDNSTGDIYFAVWSENNGQDDLIWYPASETEQNSYSCQVNLQNHNTIGYYPIHVYTRLSDSSMYLIANTVAYVDTLYTAPAPIISSQVNDGAHYMTVSAYNVSTSYTKVYFAVWSAINDQDDIMWYDANQTDTSTWNYTLDLANHVSNGTYYIHVYGVDDNGLSFIGATTDYVNEINYSTNDLLLSQYADANQVNINISNVRADDVIQNVLFAVWTMEGGQDDLVWYQPSIVTNNSWYYSFQYADANLGDIYVVHAYALLSNGTMQLLSGKTLNIY